MKTSIRTRFNIGIVVFFVVIVLLSVLSGFYLNRLSDKTGKILKENHYSVIFAREMAESMKSLNAEFINSDIQNRLPDSLAIRKAIDTFKSSLQSEKNNITEIGEDKLVEAIEVNYKEYIILVDKLLQTSVQKDEMLSQQKAYDILFQQLMLLSQMNEKAIEKKTEEAKISAKNALIQMSIIATLCFLISLSYTYSFASYFNERFSQLYNGIKEIVSSNYGQRLFFEGRDEFYDISVVFNEMAEKLSANNQKMDLPLQYKPEKNTQTEDIKELHSLLRRLKDMEEEAGNIISRFKSKE